jgi:hypothetical protein
MKNIYLKIVLVAFTISFVGCDEPETETPVFKPVVYKEIFDAYIVNDDEYLNFGDWMTFEQAGNKVWFEKKTDNNGYLEFTSYQSGNVSNIAWAITPKINMDKSENEVLTFKTATEYVTDANNKLEVFVSTDFDGDDVLGATWIPLTATIANNSTNISNTDSNGLININSGQIDLSTYSGDIYIAFKGTGSGTNAALDGSLRLDDIKIFDKTL